MVIHSCKRSFKSQYKVNAAWGSSVPKAGCEIRSLRLKHVSAIFLESNGSCYLRMSNMCQNITFLKTKVSNFFILNWVKSGFSNTPLCVRRLFPSKGGQRAQNTHCTEIIITSVCRNKCKHSRGVIIVLFKKRVALL